jgi:hypothetical protein
MDILAALVLQVVAVYNTSLLITLYHLPYLQDSIQTIIEEGVVALGIKKVHHPQVLLIYHLRRLVIHRLLPPPRVVLVLLLLVVVVRRNVIEMSHHQ